MQDGTIGYQSDLADNLVTMLKDEADYDHRRPIELNGDIVEWSDGTSESLDEFIERRADQLTGNDNGAAPDRIYTGDAKRFYRANIEDNYDNRDEFMQWIEDLELTDKAARAYIEGNYNTLDVLASIWTLETNAERITAEAIEQLNR